MNNSSVVKIQKKNLKKKKYFLSDLSLSSPLRSFCRLLSYGVITFLCIPIQMFFLLIGSNKLETFPVAYHRLCCHILGIKIEKVGIPSQERPTLFVSNHTSYLDIMILSTFVPVSFVSKAEVKGWFLFGLLAKLQRTVFINRKREDTKGHRNDILKRLDAGDNIVLFPEGTSNDGNKVLPFRSALFSVAEQRVGGRGDYQSREITIQPISIAYTKLNGFPLGYALRPMVAWYGGMDIEGHLWNLVGLGKITAVVRFHKSITLHEFGSRKLTSEYCHEIIATSLSDDLSGHSDFLKKTPDLSYDKD
ncbi:MAG: 1-acyl-sn-glycerol-3-phosphate acyltransferase [Alphaproteobacteria bacterium]|nr:1-acyl-sn-glycerol-3-phosphate acyltransferase [Alphaproteobacteria bacterium]